MVETKISIIEKNAKSIMWFHYLHFKVCVIFFGNSRSMVS